jgi:hypothetical protein
MIPRICIAAVVIAASILVAVWWVKTSAHVPLIEIPAKSVAAPASTGTTAKGSATSTATNPSVEATLTEKVATYQHSLTSKGEVMQQVWATENTTPQDLYGRVIDHYGQPVPEAEVDGNLAWIQGVDVGEKTKTYRTTTDSKGDFQFTGVFGWQLGVVPHKLGYELELRSNYRAMKKPPEGKTSATSRAIFTMWKLKGPEAMVHTKIHAYIPCDGTSVVFDLLTGKKANAEGDVMVKLLRNPVNIVRGKPFDWSVALEIANGGMTEIADMYPYEAPATGYESSVTINMPVEMKNWDATHTRSYYVKARNGQVYGRITVNIQADFQPPPTLFDVDIYVNPSSSRNLEFDPSKQIIR